MYFAKVSRKTIHALLFYFAYNNDIPKVCYTCLHFIHDTNISRRLLIKWFSEHDLMAQILQAGHVD